MKRELCPPSAYGTFVKRFFNRVILPLMLLMFITPNISAQTGEALDFKGDDDFIALPLAVSGSYTKEAWIYPRSTANFPNLISGSVTALYIDNGVLSAGHSPLFNDLIDGTGSIPTNSWTHIAVTYDAATGDMKLYKNGVEVATAVNTNAYSESNLELSRFNFSNFFDGRMDEVRIWNIARTAAEISGSMNCDINPNEAGLLAYYKFNQGEAGNNNPTVNLLIDSHDMCNPQNGTLYNFDLTSGTISNWIAPGAFTPNFCNAVPEIQVTGKFICIADGDVMPDQADGTDFGDLGATPKTETFKIFNTGTGTLTIAGVTSSDPTEFTVTTLPAASIAPGDSSSFNVVFNPSATLGIKTATITINNNDLDEGVYNFAVQGNNVGGGKALNFNGVSSWVTLPFSLTGDYTKEVWIKPDASILGTGLFPNIITGDPNTGTALFLNQGYPAAGHGPGFNQLVGTTTITAGNWTHLAVTYEAASQTLILYVDGVMQGSAVLLVPPYTEPYLNLGTFGGNNLFNGEMDEVRIWNTVRTQSEITNHMDCKLKGDEPGLIAYYDFDQGIAGGDNSSISTLLDRTDNCSPQDGVLNAFNMSGSVGNFIEPGIVTGGGSVLDICGGAEPNIRVRGGSDNECIFDGDMLPIAPDGTDFGYFTAPGIDHVFIIENNGSDVLNITGINISGPDASWFTVIVPPVLTTLLPGQSTQFTIRFAGNGLNTRQATVVIMNNDPDESNYSFAVQGEGTILVPLTLLNFSGNTTESTVNLFWNTTNEVNTSGFEILRSGNAQNNWTKLGFVAASGTNSGRYQFTDAAPVQGVNAYRLRQIDRNGEYKYSNIITFNFDVKHATVRLYPNPATTRLQVMFNDASLLNTSAEILNLTGRKMGSIRLVKYNQEVDLSKYPAGMYIIKLANGRALKLIKQ